MQSGFVTVPTSKYLHYLRAARPMGSALLQSSEKEGKEELTKIEKTFSEGAIEWKGRDEAGKANVVEWMRMWQRRRRLSNAAAMFCRMQSKQRSVWQQ